MDWVSTLLAGSGLITILSIVCTCVITLAVLGVTGFFLYRMFKGMSQNSGLVKTGVPAPAVILNVEDTGVSMNNSMQARLTLQVTPANRPPFQAVATTFVNRFQVGLLVPGASVQVKYDPADITKVAVESLSAAGGALNAANMQTIQSAVLAQDRYYEQLRQTGEEALATILTAEETNIRAAEGGSMFRFTFNVTPRIGDPFRAETQAAIADTSRSKYTVGKQVYVRYDPYGDKKQVALDRAATS
jgi:hypothetical protein